MKVSKEVCREEHEVKNCQNGKESLTDSAGKDDGRYQADHWYDRGGDFNPSLKLCIAICRALDKTLDQLFWEEDDL